MTTQVVPSTGRKPLRLWPAVALASVLVLARYVLPLVAGDAVIFGFPVAVIGILGGVACAAAIALWWLFFSRAPWPERLGAVGPVIEAMPDHAYAIERGTFRAGAAMPITSFANPAPVFDSYGPDAAAWARVVHVTGPTTIDVVTAPRSIPA